MPDGMARVLACLQESYDIQQRQPGKYLNCTFRSVAKTPITCEASWKSCIGGHRHLAWTSTDRRMWLSADSPLATCLSRLTPQCDHGAQATENLRNWASTFRTCLSRASLSLRGSSERSPRMSAFHEPQIILSTIGRLCRS